MLFGRNSENVWLGAVAAGRCVRLGLLYEYKARASKNDGKVS
jgi:hypothetical protein